MNERLQALIDKGPPVEPSEENPGIFSKALITFNDDFQKEEGRKPTSLELVVILAHFLDCREYGKDLRAWKNTCRLAERLNESGVGDGLRR